MIKKYRKRPVVIEAIRFEDNAVEIKQFAANYNVEVEFEYDENKNVIGILIPTLEGVMRANPGDYIIKGIRNEFYPCKPDVFEKTYEEV